MAIATGRVPWNRGLTKADPRVAAAEAKRRSARTYESPYLESGSRARNARGRERRRKLDPLGLRYREERARRLARAAGSITERVDYALVLARDGFTCGICDEPVSREELSFDHRIPLRERGPHTFTNVRVVHLSCNERKGEAESRNARLVAIRQKAVCHRYR